jgi:hypothetical protein
MANLHNVINALPIQYGVQLNQSYTLNPTVTGSGSIGTGNKFTLRGASGNPVFESTVGPAGGAGSWYFPNDPSNDGAAIRSVSATLPEVWDDGDYTLGFWIKVNSIPGSFYGPVGVFKLSNGVSTDDSPAILLYKDNSNNISWLYRFGGMTVGFAPPIQVGEWHFIAIRKSINDGNITFYQDMMYQDTKSTTATGSGGYFEIGFDGVIDTAFTVNISDFFIGTSSISVNDLYGVYLAGITPPRQVKYWNGNSWQLSQGQKVFNGSYWVDWNAQRWTGSQWTPI